MLAPAVNQRTKTWLILGFYCGIEADRRFDDFLGATIQDFESFANKLN